MATLPLLTGLCRDDAIGVTDPRRLLAAALFGLVHGVRKVRHPPLSRGLHPEEHAQNRAQNQAQLLL